jgi:hypothetical protein
MCPKLKTYKRLSPHERHVNHMLLRAMQAHEMRDAWVVKDRRDSRELSIVESHVNIGASLGSERRGFLSSALEKEWTVRRPTRATSPSQVDGGWSLRIISFAEFYPSLFPAPAHRLAYLSSEFLA